MWQNLLYFVPYFISLNICFTLFGIIYRQFHCLFLQALLYTHDKVACRDYEPKLFSLPHEVNEAEEAVKIVRIIKNEEPLVSKLISYNLELLIFRSDFRKAISKKKIFNWWFFFCAIISFDFICFFQLIIINTETSHAYYKAYLLIHEK